MQSLSSNCFQIIDLEQRCSLRLTYKHASFRRKPVMTAMFVMDYTASLSSGNVTYFEAGTTTGIRQTRHIYSILMQQW